MDCTATRLIALSLLAAGVLALWQSNHPQPRSMTMHRPTLSRPLATAAITLGCVLALGSGLALTTGGAADAGGFGADPLVPLASEAPARVVVDSPVPEQLAVGRVVIRYRTENLRIVPVYGDAARGVSPRIGHLHITVDDGPWRWVDASGQPLIINKLPTGPHKVLVELVDPTHQVIDSATVRFAVPKPPAQSAVHH